MKTKKTFFKLTAIVLLSMFLFSCRNEADLITSSTAKNENHDRISFKTFQHETNIKNVGEIFSEKQILQKKNSPQNPLANFIIDTVNINRIIANNELSTYAFRVYNIFNNPNDLYNVVYRKRNDGTVHYSILKMLNSKITLEYDSEKKSYLDKGIIGGSTSKYPCTEIFLEDFHCKNNEEFAQCDKCGACLTKTKVSIGDCGPSGGDTPEPPPSTNIPTFPSPPNPPVEGGSGVYYTDPSGYVFDPSQPPTLDEQHIRATRATLFWAQVSSNYQAQQWTNENPTIYQNLVENYLNNYSTTNNSQNLQFHNWAIQFLMENSTNGISDVSWTQFQEWFINVDGTSRIEFNSLANSSNSSVLNLQQFKNFLESNPFNGNFILITPPQNSNTTEVKYDLPGVWGGLNIYLNHNKINNQFIGSSANSSEYGVTLTWSWNQTNSNVSTQNNSNIFLINGTLNHNFFIEGIGTIYKEPKKFIFKTNVSNGQCFYTETF